MAQEYNRQPITRKALFIYLTPIVNYCNSPEYPLLSKWVTDHMQDIINCMGNFASSIQLTGSN